MLADLQADVLGALVHVDPETPVPWCGRWRVRHLVVHLARVHHWAAAQAARTREVPLGRGPFDPTQLYASCAAELRETLAALDPDARAATLLDDGVPREQQRGTVAFWHRRQKLETLVHLWDLRTAGGLPSDVGHLGREEQWWDVVLEVAEVMHPRQVRLARVAAPPVLVTLRRPDGEGVALDGGVPSATGLPRLEVVGSARELGLLVWGRSGVAAGDAGTPGLDPYEVRGDGVDDAAARSLLADLLRAGLTP
ncbi:hypothetical protein SERN_1961 [Serinibacter arcticus]|uniref:Mycothiol-dependent maleylpyruvate isomerase metal-binding domain-containing protein n=1 Tax=Serinibacter arcticus TaxID=1655435 RepID=A0A4Z1DZW6_9MICO|nr:hypothetical protein SERN_1961 [Serinibacter arcticus]